MNLPLPQFLPSALPRDAESREKLDLFEAQLAFYEEGFKTKLVFEPGTKAEFPAILYTWLLSVLQRSRMLAWGFVDALNTGNAIMAAMAARALAENAAYLCYTRNALSRVYAGEISRLDMTWIAFRLRFSRRDDYGGGLTHEELERTKAVNVLTAIAQMDQYEQETIAGIPENNLFSVWYGRLCEWAHPNGLGIQVGTVQDFTTSVFEYDEEPHIHEDLLCMLASRALATQCHIFELYNQCWTLLMENREQLPELHPDSDPRIFIL